MANEYTVLSNQFKQLEINPTEYQILRVIEDHRAGREIGAEYYGIHTLSEELTTIPNYEETVESMDANGIIAPYGVPVRMIATEKGRLLLKIYELERRIQYALRHLPETPQQTYLWSAQQTLEVMLTARVELLGLTS